MTTDRESNSLQASFGFVPSRMNHTDGGFFVLIHTEQQIHSGLVSPFRLQGPIATRHTLLVNRLRIPR